MKRFLKILLVIIFAPLVLLALAIDGLFFYARHNPQAAHDAVVKAIIRGADYAGYGLDLAQPELAYKDGVIDAKAGAFRLFDKEGELYRARNIALTFSLFELQVLRLSADELEVLRTEESSDEPFTFTDLYMPELHVPKLVLYPAATGQTGRMVLSIELKSSGKGFDGQAKLLQTEIAQLKNATLDLEGQVDAAGNKLILSKLVFKALGNSISGKLLADASTDSLNGMLTFNALLQQLMPIFAQPVHIAEGSLNGTIRIKGKIEEPVADGSLTLARGRYRYPPLGVDLQRINATLDFDRSLVKLKDFTAQDSAGHKLNVAGNVRLDGEHDYGFTIKAVNMALINNLYASGRITADVLAKGNAKAGSMEGTITTRPLEIKLPEHATGSIPELNLVKGTRKKQKIQTDYPLHLKLLVDAKQEVFVRGLGLDAQIGGTLNITGTATAPHIEGTLNVMRGRFEQFGKRFTLEEGTVTFDGTPDDPPTLRIVTSAEAEGVQIKPTITGTADKPTLTVESSPAMPQEEALSLLLFGKESHAISPMQALQLADAMRSMMGMGGGKSLDPLGKARKMLGVDDVKVEGEGVGVGKYLGDGVYFEVEGGSGVGGGKAKIEAEITPNVSVESSTGQRGQSSIGVFWKHDY